jgi:hypothetical protein
MNLGQALIIKSRAINVRLGIAPVLTDQEKKIRQNQSKKRYENRRKQKGGI